MNKYTPGPWHYIGDGLTHRQFDIYAPRQSPQQRIATVNNLPIARLWLRDPAAAEANARLIAAAPQLVEALKALCETAEDHGLNCDPARAILKTAGIEP